jgi:hypothetical protein
MKWTILLFVLGIAFTGCEKMVDITQPTIINKSNLNGIGDTIVFEAIEYAEIDGQRIWPDYYKWRIEQNENQIYTFETLDNSMIWIPQQEGNYIIYLKIGYNNNKSITTLKEINIELGANFLQSRLQGFWHGYYVFQYGGFTGGPLTLDISEGGHFVGNNSHYFNSAMYWGTDVDIPCAKIIVDHVSNSLGYGTVYIPFGTYCCEFLLKELEYYSDGDSLTFRVQDYTGNFNNQFIQLYLKKQ